MKRKQWMIAALLIAAVFASCASGGSSKSARKVPGGIPDFVKDALINAPEDALVGIGTAKMATTNMSLTIATNRAKADISRQMNTMMNDMIRDYTATSEVDTSAAISFQENINVALSSSQLSGARTVAMDLAEDGTTWVVVQMGKSSVVQEINQSQAAAKLAVPAMASFDAEARMNEAFAKMYAQDIQINSTGGQ